MKESRWGLSRVLMLAVAATVAASVPPATDRGPPPVVGDIVVALTSASERLSLVEASRCWRAGLRTVVALDDAAVAERLNAQPDARVHAEHYAYVPNEEATGAPEQKRHAPRSGDFRAALLPALAHTHWVMEAAAAGHADADAEAARHPAPYAWMLMGDDDTVFYLPHVRALLAGLDPLQPLALSDNLWLHQQHPNLEAARCRPCTPTSPVSSSPPEGDPVRSDPSPRRRLHQQPKDAELEGGAHPQLLSADARGVGVMRSGARRPAGGAGPGGTDDVVAHSGQDLGEEEEQEEEQAVQGSNAAKQEGEEGVPERHPAHPYTSGDKVHVRRTWGQLPAGCPQCSPDIACQGISGECQMPGAHGGAGIILSVGLMRQLDLLRLYRCISQTYGCSGGDCLLSRCLISELNVTFTDPGPSARFNSTRHVLFASPGAHALMRHPWATVRTNRCDEACRWHLRHAVSAHVGARNLLREHKDPAIAITRACWSHAKAMAWLKRTRQTPPA